MLPLTLLVQDEKPRARHSHTLERKARWRLTYEPPPPDGTWRRRECSHHQLSFPPLDIVGTQRNTVPLVKYARRADHTGIRPKHLAAGRVHAVMYGPSTALVEQELACWKQERCTLRSLPYRSPVVRNSHDTLYPISKSQTLRCGGNYESILKRPFPNHRRS